MLKSFSVRMPEQLVQMIENRARLHRRSRNAEILVLLEKTLLQVMENDLEAIRAHGRALSRLEKRSPSPVGSECSEPEESQHHP